MLKNPHGKKAERAKNGGYNANEGAFSSEADSREEKGRDERGKVTPLTKKKNLRNSERNRREGSTKTSIIQRSQVWERGLWSRLKKGLGKTRKRRELSSSLGKSIDLGNSRKSD